MPQHALASAPSPDASAPSPDAYAPPAPRLAFEAAPLKPRPPGAPRSTHLGLAARRAFGGLLALVDDPQLRDILLVVRDEETQLWVDRDGRLERVNGWRAPPDAVQRFATELIAAGGRHVDELHPSADVRLGDGIRVHAVLPPIAVSGPAVSIRLPQTLQPDFAALVGDGLCDRRTAAAIRELVYRRKNLLITGSTGTGKTTLLSALIGLAGPGERVVTIEDVAELRPEHPHVVALEARQAGAEGLGGINVDRLLREALRMRPDRIVLGECRGAEVATLLAALNTGHDGGAGTLHSSSLADVPARLEALGALAGLRPEALARQAVSALHAVIHLERVAGAHRVAAVGCLALEDGTLAIERLGR